MNKRRMNLSRWVQEDKKIDKEQKETRRGIITRRNFGE